MPSSSDLARQVREAEALVRQLEKGVPATPKQSQSSRTIKFGDGPGMVKAHGGYAGKSLIEKIRDDLAETIEELEESLSKHSDRESALAHEYGYLDGLIDGICHALGVLRGNTGEDERAWHEAAYREGKRREDG